MCKAFLYALCLENIYKCNIRSFFLIFSNVDMSIYMFTQLCIIAVMNLQWCVDISISSIYRLFWKPNIECSIYRNFDISTVLVSKYRSIYFWQMCDISTPKAKYRLISKVQYGKNCHISNANVHFVGIITTVHSCTS